MRVRAGRLDPVRRRLQDLHRLRAGQPGRDLGDTGENRLARQCVPDKHDWSLIRPGDAPSTVGHVGDGDLYNLTGLIIHGVAFSHVGAYLWRGTPWRESRLTVEGRSC